MKTKRLHLGTLMTLLFAMVCIGAYAADPEPPTITMYYPGERPADPMQFNPGAKGYIYFQSGSQVTSAKVRVTQAGALLGYARYEGRTPANNVVQINTANEPAFQSTAAGRYTVEVFEVSYIVDGNEYTYSDESHPLGSIDYARSAENGTVVSEKHLGHNTMLSYYPTNDDSDGVVVYTFSKSVLPGGISAYIEYGESNQYFIYDVPAVLSADGLTLTIDFRGVSRGIDNYLAPGVTFVDEMGQPLPPPTSIALNVDGLYCTDGSRIQSEASSLDGLYTTTLNGSLYKAYHYEDLTFANPAITGVEFYSKADPTRRYGVINDETDMMDLKILNIEYIASADMILSVDNVSARVANSDITKSATAMTIQLPASIKAAGSDGLVVALDNVVYTEDDGSLHEIKPYGTSSAIPEVQTLAALKQVTPGEKVVINALDGVKVTLANEFGYTFIEDSYDGVMVITSDYTQALPYSTLVKGRIVGTYLGYGTFMIDKNASAYIESPVDVAEGALIESLGQLSDGTYDNRLVTIIGSASMPITVDGDMIMIAGTMPVITDFIVPFEAPEVVVNVTGVYYDDASIGQPVILVRNMGDFNHNYTPEIWAETLAELKTYDIDTEVNVILNDAVVTYSHELGFSIIEDATGAIRVWTADDSQFSETGKKLNGTLKGVVFDESIIVLDDYDIEETDADVSTGATIPLDEIGNKENIYRLVTITNSTETPIISEPSGLMIGDKVACVDYFGVLGDSYEMPDSVAKVTGIIMPGMNVMSADDEMGAGAVTLVAVRSHADIVPELSGITSIKSDTVANGDIYYLNGVKVSTGTATRESLTRGIYIIDGNKVMIK